MTHLSRQLRSPSVLELNWAEQDFIRGAYTGRTAEAGPAAPRCWPPVRFAWDAAAQTLALHLHDAQAAT